MNEAANRLRVGIRGHYWSRPEMLALVDDALATERQRTVEQVRLRVGATGIIALTDLHAILDSITADTAIPPEHPIDCDACVAAARLTGAEGDR